MNKLKQLLGKEILHQVPYNVGNWNEQTEKGGGEKEASNIQGRLVSHRQAETSNTYPAGKEERKGPN